MSFDPEGYDTRQAAFDELRTTWSLIGLILVLAAALVATLFQRGVT